MRKQFKNRALSLSEAGAWKSSTRASRIVPSSLPKLITSVGIGLAIFGDGFAAKAADTPASWNKEISYSVLQSGKSTNPAPKAGDLVGIRFKVNNKYLFCILFQQFKNHLCLFTGHV